MWLVVLILPRATGVTNGRRRRSPARKKNASECFAKLFCRALPSRRVLPKRESPLQNHTPRRGGRGRASRHARDGPRGVSHARAARADGRGPRGRARHGTNPARARRWRWFVPRWRRRGSRRTRPPPALPAGKPRGRRVESDVRLPAGAGTSARTRKARRVAAFPRPRPSAMPSSRETAMSHRHLLRMTRRSASRSSWRGAGCAAVARPRS